MEVRKDYTKEYDILSIFWGKGYDYSEEFTSEKGHNFVIDYNKKGKIIGIEIFDWKKGNDKNI